MTPAILSTFNGNKYLKFQIKKHLPVNNPEEPKCIQHMHGRYRLPTMLKRVDQLCRGRVEK